MTKAEVLERVGNGYIVVAKRECATCVLVEPVVGALADAASVNVYSQDDPAFPETVIGVIDDTQLDTSYFLEIETVPTVIKVENGLETGRIVGWNKNKWREFTGISDLGDGLPEQRPGCGSRSVEPALAIDLAIRHGGINITSRRIEVAALEDEWEACYDRGWSDGLPVVPPTPERVVRMLEGTSRDPQEVVGVISPDLAECTVEKVAINAVMAGCKPEYMPVVLAAVEASCMDEFCMHGLLATTWFSGPVVIVNGPIAKKIGMNSGGNCLGQGNRANASIGRALQLIIRNVGGGRPGEVDRATLGNPGKYTFCFAEDEENSPWEPLSVARGIPAGKSAVTLFPGDGVQGIMDQLSRDPESLTKSFAESLKAVSHHKICMASDCILVVSPEHGRVYKEAGWDRARLEAELMKLTMRPGADLIRGANGIAEGLPEHLSQATIPKFRPGGILAVHAGGKAGLFSAIIGGWLATGGMGSNPVTREIVE